LPLLGFPSAARNTFTSATMSDALAPESMKRTGAATAPPLQTDAAASAAETNNEWLDWRRFMENLLKRLTTADISSRDGYVASKMIASDNDGGDTQLTIALLLSPSGVESAFV
jgi:hypothetical protein